MSIHIDDLRDIAANHGWPVCDLAADEIEDLEKAYALLFSENSRHVAELAAAREQVRVLREALAAMIEDGWLAHGHEGMSPAQEKVFAALAATQQGVNHE